MNLELLLSQITAISKRYDEIYKKTGGYFNIFEIANIESNEVTICRVLHEFLNPEGSHCQGFVYLKLFMNHVLKIEMSDYELARAKVHREYRISEDRRIDLVIETATRLIPIEVKIYAGDQSKQCYDYKKVAKNSEVYYLTLSGNLPSPESAFELVAAYDEFGALVSYENITLISFQADILTWLNKCLEVPETIRIASIREVLFQLIGTIRKLTNQMEEGKEMEMIKLLSASKEHMQAALEIESSLKQCKIEMIKKLLTAIEEALPWKKLNNEYDYEYNDYQLVNQYYERKSSSFPGVSYDCGSIGNNGVQLWLRVEIDNLIYGGFCTPQNGKKTGEQLNTEEIKAILPECEPEVDGWWICWEYLPSGENQESPSFKELDAEYLNLFDEKNFVEFVNQSVENIMRNVGYLAKEFSIK